ncbi:hypothetical protein MYP_1515 [Sporocytophaga myxococcoides]|uniref:Uncharacterized protein n=1 Tax=Sporocytophaga myxococcoides TaxID=153721 RepID=A0A098LD12_9BACT|nr:hypothetical protein MYP_1515 [Sporocytophaga myxococcoides]
MYQVLTRFNVYPFYASNGGEIPDMVSIHYEKTLMKILYFDLMKVKIVNYLHC